MDGAFDFKNTDLPNFSIPILAWRCQAAQSYLEARAHA
jgi:hypothetical protein